MWCLGFRCFTVPSRFRLDALLRAVELHYGPTQYDNPRAQLFKLKQTSSVVQFHTAFMTLANRVEGLSDAALMDCFVSGLKDGIKRDVLAREPDSLLRAVALAKLYDVGFSTLGFGPKSRALVHEGSGVRSSASFSPPLASPLPPL